MLFAGELAGRKVKAGSSARGPRPARPPGSAHRRGLPVPSPRWRRGGAGASGLYRLPRRRGREGLVLTAGNSPGAGEILPGQNRARPVWPYPRPSGRGVSPGNAGCEDSAGASGPNRKQVRAAHRGPTLHRGLSWLRASSGRHRALARGCVLPRRPSRRGAPRRARASDSRNSHGGRGRGASPRTCRHREQHDPAPPGRAPLHLLRCNIPFSWHSCTCLGKGARKPRHC